MKNINIYILSLLGALSIGFTSCDEYLDKAESGGMTLDEIFGDYTLSERYLTTCYAALPNEYAIYSANASDEAKAPQPGFDENIINSGSFSPTRNPYNNWTATYQAIRTVNIFLQNADRIPVTSPVQEAGKPRMISEAHFLRAYFYMDLFRRWGAVPIIQEPLDPNEDLSIARNPVEEVVSFICNECDLATANLLEENVSTNLGRATKGAALALKARVLLYFASELHNPTNIKKCWEDAADAANEVMKLNIYQLHDDYKKLFNTRVSKEIIFQHTVNYTNYTLHMSAPSQGGQARITPLQNLIDAYEMKDGIAPFIFENGVRKINPDSDYDPENPYINRDPRFYMSILYNGSIWKGNTIYTYEGAPNDGIGGGYNNTPTGYYLAKLIDEEASLKPPTKTGNNYWIYFRYAEILLNYAEALNESLDKPDSRVYSAINDIRDRTGVKMPALPSDLSKEQMRDRIRNERRIELAFEGHRFFDMKRWRIGSTIMPKAYGMRPISDAGGYIYTYFLLENRVYPSHWDLFPIMQTELNRNPALEQNPGYQK